MLYVLLGETASGKTATALALCRELGLPLVSADAFAVYRGFDIGSAKPTAGELAGLESYFISSQPFGKPYSVYDFQREGRAVLARLAADRKDAVIAGGTFLYVRALLFPYEFPVGEKPAASHAGLTPGELRSRLLRLAPAAGKTVDLANPRRVERALALAEAGHLPARSLHHANKPLYPAVFIRLATDPVQLRERIAARVDEQVAAGLFAEAARLAAQNPDFARAFKGIGFREIYAGLATGRSRDAIIESIKSDTRKYAKRQRTFLRHQFPYLVELARAKVLPLVRADAEGRKTMADCKMLEQNGMLLPLVPILAKEYLPWIDSLYRQGVRQIGVFTLDQTLKKDFANNIHIHSPLMQILYFDQDDFADPRLPAFSFVLPLVNDLKADPLLAGFVKDRRIASKLPAGLTLA